MPSSVNALSSMYISDGHKKAQRVSRGKDRSSMLSGVHPCSLLWRAGKGQ